MLRQIRWLNWIILFATIGLTNILVSAPLTTTREHVLASFVGAVLYGAGWRMVVETRVAAVLREGERT